MSDLQRIGDDLEGLLRRLGLPAPGALEHLLDDWARVAGEPWAERAVPVGLHRGELVVEVADGTTASLLKYQVNGLLERLEEGLERAWSRRCASGCEAPKRAGDLGIWCARSAGMSPPAAILTAVSVAFLRGPWRGRGGGASAVRPPR